MNKNEKPVQLVLLYYPKTNNWTFQCSFYSKFNWLEYSISDDAVFCFPCRHFSFNGHIRGQSIGNAAYFEKGVKCSNALQSLTKHGLSENHLTSVERWNTYLAIQVKQNSVANLLKSSRALEIENNKNHVFFLLKATIYLT